MSSAYNHFRFSRIFYNRKASKPKKYFKCSERGINLSIVKLSNISKSYGSNVIFNDYSLEIEKGEFVIITGKSGAGKSTLLNIIGLLDKADSGDVEICGIKNPFFQSKEGNKLLRYHISYLFQNYGLIEDETVIKNLEVGTKYLKLSKEQKKQKINEALKSVGLENYENKKVFQLSGGEQQRVAVARIMLKPSELILADEPTGSLDVENRDVILSLLKSLNENGKTVVVVTHDKDIEKYATRCIRI